MCEAWDAGESSTGTGTSGRDAFRKTLSRSALSTSGVDVTTVSEDVAMAMSESNVRNRSSSLSISCRSSKFLLIGSGTDMTVSESR